ncbi:STAS domain-containing protein [Candidatus Riflebacteria bacterium]
MVGFEKNGDISIFTIRGTELSEKTGVFLRKMLENVANQGELKKVILDLGKVELADTHGVAALIAALKKVDEKEGNIRVVSTKKKLRKIFGIIKLDCIFPVYASLTSAMKSF